jgi:N-hydroxyarylamine O-acetyltransferase
MERLRLRTPPRFPDAESLRTLHAAHVATIPFENLDVFMERRINLDIGSLQDKLVRRRRGGYCFEHNLLFAAVLEEFGYDIMRLAGRVNPDKGGPRTHLLVLARADGRWWLADAGFGGELLAPIPLAEVSVRQGGWTYQLIRKNDRWRLRARLLDGWTTLYEFATEPVEPVDCEVNNHYTSTHPRSPFVGQIVAFRSSPYRRERLKGSVVTTTFPDRPSHSHTLSPQQILTTLSGVFGIELNRQFFFYLRLLLKLFGVLVLVCDMCLLD